VIQPGLSATDLLWFCRGIVFWFVINILSLVWMFVNLIRDDSGSKILWFFWLLSTIFLGPVSVWVFKKSHTSKGHNSSSQNKEAWALSVFLVGIYATGWGVSFSLLPYFGSNPAPLVILCITYFIPAILGFATFQILFLVSGSATGVKERLVAGLSGVFISMNVAFAVMFPLMMIFDHLFSTIPGSFNPFIWGMLSLLSLVNLIVEYPVNNWMNRHGLFSWQSKKQIEHITIPSTAKKRAWPVLITSIFILVVSLAVTISQLA
jgi:hypothetical protein